ncbi:hypothetical protein CAC42_4060 [Sphaceloma murrayae]|uniref:Integral membrane protein n=1 Tax=Sphaceloma murrayae TaxID=2082308 RepID=A0A2K1QST2_9PEZI|nr:hypothetical protein CAC42_4060 [Sphaceloma murrayae]
MDPEPPQNTGGQPSIIRWVLGFLLVGMAWGMTTPFMRKAAVQKDEEQREHPGREFLEDPSTGIVKKKFWTLVYAVIDLLRRPAYAIPLIINLTGSIWFFLLIGHAEISLMVPITNSLAFMFTVLGEYLAEGKAISRDTFLGMGLVLGGIGLCVHSKNT